MDSTLTPEPVVETRIILSPDAETHPHQARFAIGAYSPLGRSSMQSNYVQVDDERHGRVNVTPQMKAMVDKDNREYCPQRTAPWYEKRRNHLTASAIATAVGKNPYETRLQCLGKKVWKEPAWTGNVATEHGNKYEDVAIGRYEEYSGHKVLHFGLLESLHTETESFIAGSPDGITTHGRLIEVKCPYRRKPNGTVPHHYMFQLQCLMNILDLEVCDFVEYVPDASWTSEQLWIIEVKRSRAFWAHYMPALRRFWTDVEEMRAEQGDNTEPPPPPPKKPRATPQKRHHPMLADLDRSRSEMGADTLEAYKEERPPPPCYYHPARESTWNGEGGEEVDLKVTYGRMLVDMSKIDIGR